MAEDPYGVDGREPASPVDAAEQRRLADIVDDRSERARPRDPGGPLLISGGGSIGVSTDGLLVYLARWGSAAQGLEECRRLLVRISDAANGEPFGPPLAQTRAPFAEAMRAVVHARDSAGDLRAGVEAAVRAYSAAEAGATAVGQQLAGMAAVLIGRALPAALVAVVAASPLLVLGALVANQVIPGTSAERGEELRRWFQAHPEIITDPGFVEAVRAVAMHSDNAWLGSLGMPPWLAALVSDDRIGVLGPESTAAAVLALGGAAGLLRETAVRVERTSATSLPTAAAGVGERLRRVPEDDQVRIERFDAPGLPPRWVVYIAPTNTFTPTLTDEPWDLASNIGGVAGRPSGSIRATAAAMTEAGIAAGDEVQFVGFSQGGLNAAALAASGAWTTAGLETHGAPTGNIPLPDALPGMAIRHSDDLVPALAGRQLPTDRLQIEQQAFPDEIPTNQVAPAHQRDSYYSTARTIDDARSPRCGIRSI